MIPIMRHSREGKTMGTEIKVVTAQGLGLGVKC